jgi:iron complex transport system substrate-binding protein
MRRPAALVLLAAFAVACSTSQAAKTPSVSPSATFPVTIAASGGPVTIPAQPQRIVSLGPTTTEMLFAIGAGAQVVAVDDQSNYPANAPHSKLSGFTPNVEAIAGYRPDLVVITNDINGVMAGLKKVSIPVLLEPAANTIDDTYAEIEQLGLATGHATAAGAVVKKMRSQIAALVASAPRFSTPATYYHELDPTYYTATSKTFIGSIYSMLGMSNIADPADKKASGYPQLSAEFIIKADPDFIFLADTKCCGQSAATVAKRPGWSALTAVKEGRIVALDDDVVSRWGPRVVDFIREVVTALRAMKQAA